MLIEAIKSCQHLKLIRSLGEGGEKSAEAKEKKNRRNRNRNKEGEATAEFVPSVSWTFQASLRHSEGS